MRKLHYIICILISMFVSTKYTSAQTPYVSVLSLDPIYQLKFEDEFDSTAINANKWVGQYQGWCPAQHDSNKWYLPYYGGEIDMDYNFPLTAGDPYNNRGYDVTGTGYTKMFTRYHPATVTGYIWDFVHNPDTIVGVPFKFTTAMLEGKDYFKYCYVEVRFKTSPFTASQYNAYAPNVWMWTSDSLNPYSEIDISEMAGKDWTTAPCSHLRRYNPIIDSLGGHYPPGASTTADTVFWHGNTLGTPATYYPYSRHHSGAMTPGQWHTLGCEWTPEYIDFYYYSLSADTFQRFSINKYPVDKLTAMPLIIDNYTPAYRDNFITNFVPGSTQMDFEYDIDYVRFWQVRQNCISQSFLNIASASAYTSTLYKDLTIGGSGSTGCNFTSGNTHLAANDFVLLKEGFVASGSSTTVLINTMKCQTDQNHTYHLTVPNPPNPIPAQTMKDMKDKLTR